MAELIKKTEGRVLRLTMNRPELRNALDAALVSSIRSALDAAARDESVRVVVITGSGKAFSAGADLAELGRLQDASLVENRRSSENLASLFSEIRRHPKPIVARVNGHAIAGGCGLMLACDFSVVSSEAKLGFTEVRIGFVPAIVSALLRGRVSDPAMRDLLLTGRLVTAIEAWELGLASRVVEPDQLDHAVSEITDTIVASTSPTAIAMTKRMLAVTEAMPPAAAATFLASFNALARKSEDVRKGVSAFLNKNPPDWT